MTTKKILASICIVICISIVLWKVYCQCKEIDIATQKDFCITKIEVLSPQEHEDYYLTGQITWEKRLSEHKREEILKNMEQYRILKVSYTLSNVSDSKEIMDIRVYPKGKILDVVCFTSGNGEFPINVSPLTTGGVTQTIIVKTNGMSDDALQKMFMEQRIKLIYRGKLRKHCLLTTVSEIYRPEIS